FVVPFIERLNKPIVTTFHTVIKSPPADVRNIVYRIGKKSAAVTVMAETCVDRLKKYYKIPKKKILVIPHGVPDVAFTSTEPYKKRLGLSGQIVISAINLLSDGKGLEYVVKALPMIVKKHPEVIFKVIGITHPEVIKWQGETYRRGLVSLARKLGVEKNLQFDNRYVSLEELIEYLMATDFYITPYVGADQTASGTLAYALAAGKLCLSSPYVYAKEILANGRGEMIGFRNERSIAQKVNYHIENPKQMETMKKKAYEYGREMIWHSVGLQHLNLFRLLSEKKK
ncbi:glycosyltransferase, partial [Patescibacteria group bacterium]|nr:glycosyltransferase [Patescibacteria group bacterium]